MVSDVWNYIVTEEDYLNTVCYIEDLIKLSYKDNSLIDYQQLNDSADNIESILTIHRDIQTVNDKVTYLKDLKSELEKGKEEIKLTLVTRPNKIIKNKIGEWIKKNLGVRTVAVIEVEPEILGGAIISFKGDYYDGSLRKKMEGWLNNYKEFVYGR